MKVGPKKVVQKVGPKKVVQKVGPTKVVHSRYTTAGPITLVQALRVFSPTSTDLPSNEKELVSYIEQLRNDGHRPTVLKSTDVYRYRSCTSVVKPAAKLNITLETANQKVQKPGKRKGKKTQEKKTELKLSPAAKVILKNQPTILLRNMSTESLKETFFSKPQTFRTAPTQMSTRIKLTNISGPSKHHTARLQFHTGVWSGNSHHPPSAHGCTVNGLRRVNLGMALNGVPLPDVHRNGWVLRESNGMPGWRDQKRKWEEMEDKLVGKRPRNGVCLFKTRQDSQVSKNNCLRSEVIKVDDSTTDEEVRRKAQRILRVNLSPVIEIQPLLAYPV